MRVLALNGSPRSVQSCTYMLLKPLLDGMREAGAETEIIHVHDLHLSPCKGCFSCWVRTPGSCIQRDGMAEALDAYTRADLVVFGTPLYFGTVSGTLKVFLDRLLPRSEPWLIPSAHVPGLTGHPPRWRGPSQSMLVSPCGFPELENFDALVLLFRHIARMHGMEYVGHVLRPFAEPLRIRGLQGLFQTYFEQLREAGRHVVLSGGIPDALKAQLERDLMPGGVEKLREMANASWSAHLHASEAGSE